MTCNSKHDHCEHAEKAAKEAVRKTFAILGVDVDDPKQVKDFQESLCFGDKMRKLADQSTTAFVLAIVATMAGAFLLSLRAKVGP